MTLKSFLLLFLVHSVISDTEVCVPYNFENDFESLFSRSRMCTTLGVQGDWISGKYDTILEEPTNNMSSTFISPALPNTLSCTTSFTFEVSSGSEFEIHVFLESELGSDGLQVFVNQVIDDGNMLTLSLNTLQEEYRPGWNVLKGNLDGTGTFEGYVTIMGMASTDAVLLIDAFRYIPASLDNVEDNEECVIYRAVIDENESVEDNTDEDNGGSEEIGSNETDENGETENGSNQTEDNGETGVSEETGHGSNETEPITEDPNDYTFWNALTITMTVLVSFILLSIICFVCYECGKRRAQDKNPLIFADVETPTPTLVPRVTKLYPEPNIVY